ncbi:MAG: Glycerol-3-phosphate acyltransferase [Steroidobacteraceae bacterium]|nr:Glycerol-3-phosphate acyltransferase [Steroidobacteraceae bacterium]
MEWLLRRLLSLWVRVTVRPEDMAERLAARTAPVCYVLERASSTDLAVLQNVCARHRFPRPGARLARGELRRVRAWFYLSRPLNPWSARVDRRPPAALHQLIAALQGDPALDIDLVPVAVYWGRAPQKEDSWLRLALSEDWALATRLRKALTVVFNGRATMVEFSDPVSLRSLLSPGDRNPQLQARRIARVARAQFRRQRAARIGPDLSHRRTIVASVLRTRAVRAAVAAEARERQVTRREALLTARRFAGEIAANYSHRFVTIMEKVLRRLWNRLYDGVIVGHVETLAQVAEGNEVVYVPCHRSHMDYLLLSYAIFRQGYAVPHIAAGVNLNLPLIGRFLRKGGAFFIRRSFRGNALYTVVFMKYLATIMARGHSIEFFIEGGRSRTGRLLAPKTGMLSMTIRSYLREPVRPIVFVPVYFGYERVVEAATYVSELSGKPKEKESVFGLLRSLRVVREKFGKVHVNLGEPIALDAVLAGTAPDWRTQTPDGDGRAPWVAQVVDETASRLMRNINAAAALTPVNLLALTLLATPRQAMLRADLLRQIELYLALLAAVPYGPRVTVTTETPEAILAYGEAMKLVSREAHKLGDIVRMSEANAVLSAWYRNNVLHLLAMPSLIACAFVGNSIMRTEDIHRLVWRVYPYIAAELFMRWNEDEIGPVTDQLLAALAARGLITATADGTAWRRAPSTTTEAVQLSFLARATIQTVERYYLAIAVLINAGSGQITQAALEERCQLMAQRMTMLHGFNSPEFFDRSLFADFLDRLRDRAVIRVGGGGLLAFDDVLARVARDAEFVLSEQIRHSILQVVHT